MLVAIEIPYEFQDHWDKDYFEDSLRRLKADADTCEGCSGNYEAELCDMLITAFKSSREFLTCTDCDHSHSQHIDHSKMCKLLGVYPAPDGYCYAGKRKEELYER